MRLACMSGSSSFPSANASTQVATSATVEMPAPAAQAHERVQVGLITGLQRAGLWLPPACRAVPAAGEPMVSTLLPYIYPWGCGSGMALEVLGGNSVSLSPSGVNNLSWNTCDSGFSVKRLGDEPEQYRVGVRIVVARPGWEVGRMAIGQREQFVGVPHFLRIARAAAAVAVVGALQQPQFWQPWFEAQPDKNTTPAMMAAAMRRFLCMQRFNRFARDRAITNSVETVQRLRWVTPKFFCTYRRIFRTASSADSLSVRTSISGFNGGSYGAETPVKFLICNARALA